MELQRLDTTEQLTLHFTSPLQSVYYTVAQVTPLNVMSVMPSLCWQCSSGFSSHPKERLKSSLCGLASLHLQRCCSPSPRCTTIPSCASQVCFSHRASALSLPVALLPNTHQTHFLTLFFSAQVVTERISLITYHKRTPLLGFSMSCTLFNFLHGTLTSW